MAKWHSVLDACQLGLALLKTQFSMHGLILTLPRNSEGKRRSLQRVGSVGSDAGHRHKDVAFRERQVDVDKNFVVRARQARHCAQSDDRSRARPTRPRQSKARYQPRQCSLPVASDFLQRSRRDAVNGRTVFRTRLCGKPDAAGFPR